MLGHEDEALQTDAYIDALLAAHAGRPVMLPGPDLLPPDSTRHVIQLLETGLPRFHPSFRFEQQLAARLRLAAMAQVSGRIPPPGDIISLPSHIGGHPLPVIAVDRRLLLGGAIASGVSLAGAAMIAWRMRERGRGRRGLLA